MASQSRAKRRRCERLQTEDERWEGDDSSDVCGSTPQSIASSSSEKNALPAGPHGHALGISSLGSLQPGHGHFNVVCYGMVMLGILSALMDAPSAYKSVCFQLEQLPIAISTPANTISSSRLACVYMANNKMIHRESDGTCLGTLDGTAARALSVLAREDMVHIQLMVKAMPDRDQAKPRDRAAAFVSAIIYGPHNLAGDVGDFLDKCKYYLQDPFGCQYNVPYINPHCISSLFEAPVMTFDLLRPEGSEAQLSISGSLKALETVHDLPESIQPAMLKTDLCSHQKKGLWFLLHRESNVYENPIWQSRQSANGTLIHVNTITGAPQHESPANWNGGILADDMGLGKTLQMIALIAADIELRRQHKAKRIYHPSAMNATLVVVPVNVLSVWETQLRRHVHDDNLTWVRHHRRRKSFSRSTANHPDIVLTTYHTVQSEFKNKSKAPSALFDRTWRRIILDEAHVIRNRNTATSDAITSLKAVSRWAVTGTPIQNGLLDIASLLQFLHFQPYDCAKAFDTDIVKFFRQKDVEEGTRRLKALCQCIMLRRSKGKIDLPPRQDTIRTVDFSPDEEREYRSIETGLQWLYDSSDQSPGNGSTQIKTIQLFIRLRMFCNLGLGSKLAESATNQPCSASPRETDSVGAVVASNIALGDNACAGCQQPIDTLDDQNAFECGLSAYHSQCGQLFCGSCAALNSYNAAAVCSCPGESPCPLRFLPSTSIQKVVEDRCQSNEPACGVQIISSKAEAVVKEVLACIPEKSVVFSSWVSSLIMVQRALEAADVRCVRIDGSVTQACREVILEQFRTNNDIKVILVTVSIGAVGLDLTAASRVHLLEPQWNPAVEDQALARVHRMGQQRPVTTIRYITSNSIEESVSLVKMNKQLLADLLLKKEQNAKRKYI